MRKKVWSTFIAFLKQLSGQNLGAFASSISFFFLMSLVPVLLIGCGLMTYLPISEHMLLQVIYNYFPGFLDDTMGDIVVQVFRQYKKIFPFAIIVLVWSAGKAVWALKMGLNSVNNVKETRFFLIIRIKASIYSVIMMAVLILCIGMVILTESIAVKMSHNFPVLSEWIVLLGNFRFVVVWGFITLFMTFIYTYLPNKELRLRYQIPGATLTATVWALFSWGFSAYVEHFHSYDVYGNLSTLVIIMVWMYTCMYMMLLGANVNRFYEEQIKKLFDRRLFSKKVATIVDNE